LYWTDNASRAFISRQLTPQPKIVKRLVQLRRSVSSRGIAALFCVSLRLK